MALRSHHSPWLSTIMGLVLALPAGAQPPPATAKVSTTSLDHGWMLTELVLENHLDPPARQEMLLSGMKAVFQSAGVELPRDLGRQISGRATKEQLFDYVRSVWPKAPAAMKPGTSLEERFLKGLLSCVPGEPHLLDASYAKIAAQLSANRYVGIGVQLSMPAKQPFPQIIVPFRRGAARLAGAKPGDFILQVDGKSTEDVQLEKIIEWLRGPDGTVVTIVVRQPGQAAPRTLKLTRGVIPIDTVLGYRRLSEEKWQYRLAPEVPIGYVCVRSIKSSTLSELRQAERRMQTEGIAAVVLDFRFSQGEGVLHNAEVLADGLLDGGVLWRMHDAKGQTKEFRADRECLFRAWPLAVLVNDHIIDNGQGAVLAALKDNHRAVLVGEPPAANGFVNTVVPIPGTSNSLVVRTARLVRAAANETWPLTPDHVVPSTAEDKQALEQWLRQKELPELPAGVTDRPPPDPQLAKAVQVLRAQLGQRSI